MDSFIENIETIKGIRSKLLNFYVEKIEGISGEDWKNIKKRKFFYFRDFCMNKIVTKFRIPSSTQKSGSEEESIFPFSDVRRLLCYLLLGNDYTRKWKNTKEMNIGEPLCKEIIEKVKEVGKTNDCQLFKVFFDVEEGHDLGDYSLKLTPHIEALIDRKIASIPERTPAHKIIKSSVAKGSQVRVLNDTKSKKVSRTPMDSYITPDTIVAMTSALEAIAEARNKTDMSRSEKATMVIKLCQLTADLIDGHDI